MKITAKVLLLVLCLSVAAMADTVSLPFTYVATLPNNTGVYRANVNGLGLTRLGSVTITDNANGTGSAGIFSGFDVDALFLDADGNLATTGDRVFASGFVFSGGSVMPTADPYMQPNASHPGPLFGSLSLTTIDVATATLNVMDGVSNANVYFANGFLSLGEGGMLTANFAPEIPITGNLYVITGEVGNNGEGLAATITASDTQVPEPATLLLVAGAALALIGYRRLKA